MILVPSDVSSLSQSLGHWETAEYVFEAFVILGCAGEVIADLAPLPERGKKKLERISTMVLVVALSLGLFALMKTNELSGSVIGGLGKEAEEADAKAKKALADAAAATKQSTEADNDSAAAVIASSRALTLASGARTEADSFEQDIKTAKGQAASAESHLAEALEKAADATRALREEEVKREAIEKRLAPRSLRSDRIAALIKRLKQFVPQRIDVITYPHDTEAGALANSFLNVLINAGWKWNRFEPMDSEGITGIFIEFDRSDAKSVKAAQSLFDEIKSPDLTVVGPAPTLPRAYHIGYTGPQGIAPDAPIRITIGGK